LNHGLKAKRVNLANSAQKNQPKKLDQIDCQIISLLQADGRLPNTEIAKRVGISEATVRLRLNRLISENFIQIVAVSNPLKLGFKAVGILKIRVDVKKIKKVVTELEKLNPIWYIVHTTGNSEIYTEFIAKSIEDLHHLINENIYTIDGVLHTESSIIMNYVKRRYDWGTAIDQGG
jgi:Lrp/AsnC family transcriptional regulator for asnA, asnC and gidA